MNKISQIIKELQISKIKNDSNLIIVIPTYNEIENITNIIDKINLSVSKNNKFEILIVDDNSPDKTALKISEVQNKISNLHLYARKNKQGLGSAYLEAFEISIKSDFEFLITMDADFSHDPSEINNMIKEIKNYDIVIGSRYTSGGKIVNFELWRKLTSKTGNYFARIFININVKDCSSGYRCYRVDMLNKLNLFQKNLSKRYIFLVELISLIYAYKYRIKEIPITFVNRKYGKTKISFSELLYAFYRLLKLFFSKITKNEYSPYQSLR